jgi:hypothetical protein
MIPSVLCRRLRFSAQKYCNCGRQSLGFGFGASEKTIASVFLIGM